MAESSVSDNLCTEFIFIPDYDQTLKHIFHFPFINQFLPKGK